MELTHLEYLEEILNSKDACDHLTGYQKMVIDALTELLSYCPYERLCELAQADQEGRVRIEEKTYQCPKCGAYRLTPRLDNQYYFCFKCKTQFTKEQAEAALRREQDG